MMTRYRKFITSGVGFTFVIVGTTGVIFQFFFKNRVLEQIHGWLGVGMVTLAVFHITQNWKSLLNHFRDRRVFGLLVPVALVAGYLVFGQKHSDNGVNPRLVVHKLSEARADDLARVFGKNVDAVFTSMKNAGLRAGNTHEKVEELARENAKPPEEILVYFTK